MIHSEPCRAVVRPMTRQTSRHCRASETVVSRDDALVARASHRHLSIFPEGQLVAVDENGRVVGSSSSHIIDWDDYADSAKWSLITGDGTFETHNPLGKTLYGAESAWTRSCAAGASALCSMKLARILSAGWG